MLEIEVGTQIDRDDWKRQVEREREKERERDTEVHEMVYVNGKEMYVVILKK